MRLVQNTNQNAGFIFMTAFNIKFEHEGKKVTLTIIPKDDYYLIVYFGGILGAIRNRDTDWMLLKKEEINNGALSYYDHSSESSAIKITLGTAEINQIAGEIENHSH
ncbi:hypothetical protein EZ449_05755 [Pedobacter frigidisoli]|uniref:Uncharacterized protein n=1 Tax=Pedobacter frigidisoli TaxID=2530455 RepID=A0A4R0P2G6_9SPHI|nr:hypothetical protein [Pedobacter frigidisoli]TCD11004.1 hypothetical protein EZ449_05755 [Pedobacter frigidisoli]